MIVADNLPVTKDGERPKAGHSSAALPGAPDCLPGVHGGHVPEGPQRGGEGAGEGGDSGGEQQYCSEQH